MTDIYEAMEKLGLTRNEVTIYKYLLRKGISTGAQIWAENSLDKSSAYRAIGQLQEKRLIYAIGETRNQKFSAYPVEALKGLHQKVASKLDQVSKDIDSFIENINEYAKDNYKSSRIQLYEGPEGAKLFYKERLKGHVDMIRQFGIWEERKDMLKDYGQFMEGFVKERNERKIPIKILFDASQNPIHFGSTDEKNLKEVRKLDHKMNLSAMMAVHGDSVSISTKEDGSFLGLVIRDRLVSDLMAQMFEYMWDQAKKV